MTSAHLESQPSLTSAAPGTGGDSPVVLRDQLGASMASGSVDSRDSHRSADVLVLGQMAFLADLRFRLPDLEIRLVEDASAFLAALMTGRPRVVVTVVPPGTGQTVEAVAALRKRRSSMRTVLLNDEASVDDRLRALEIGYDAALTIAVPVDELAGRLALLARHSRPGRERLAIADGTELDVMTCELLRDGRPVHLRPKEFRLLELLARHPGRVYTRGQLLDRVWGPDRAGDPRTVDVHVRWLRAKIEPDPERPTHLVTVRGMGYRLDPDAR